MEGGKRGFDGIRRRERAVLFWRMETVGVTQLCQKPTDFITPLLSLKPLSHKDSRILVEKLSELLSRHCRVWFSWQTLVHLVCVPVSFHTCRKRTELSKYLGRYAPNKLGVEAPRHLPL